METNPEPSPAAVMEPRAWHLSPAAWPGACCGQDEGPVVPVPRALSLSPSCAGAGGTSALLLERVEPGQGRDGPATHGQAGGWGGSQLWCVGALAMQSRSRGRSVCLSVCLSAVGLGAGP